VAIELAFFLNALHGVHDRIETELDAATVNDLDFLLNGVGVPTFNHGPLIPGSAQGVQTCTAIPSSS
jgi:hypothetical protein